MSDDADELTGIVADDASGGAVGGERLAEARRALQITVLEIAKELHLDEFKVRAMESNDFEVIGAPVFAKGHLRKYAQLVKVNEADVMADYYQLTRSHGAPPALAPRPRARQPISLGPWIAASVVVLVAATGYWLYANPASDENDEASEAEPVPILQPEELPQPAMVADSNTMQLSITYVGDCWTEITDATGRRLYFDLGIGGRTVNLSGEAPFSVLFGDADNVTLEVNGATFNIPADDRRGKTARLTIAGS
jgi:cytoskeleton protein RodZ